MTISVDEDATLVLGKIMSSAEHGGKYRAFELKECVFGCSQLVSTTDIKLDNVFFDRIHLFNSLNLLVPNFLLH